VTIVAVFGLLTLDLRQLGAEFLDLGLQGQQLLHQCLEPGYFLPKGRILFLKSLVIVLHHVFTLPQGRRFDNDPYLNSY